MPKLKLNLPSHPQGWTKTPNDLLDRLMPTLKDTEFRVLLVLLRQTTGWNRTGRPVILKYQALIRRTGRQSEALSKALRSLEAKGLIHIVRASGHPNTGKAKRHGSVSEGQQYKESKWKNKG